MVKIKCKECGGEGNKTYPFGKKSKAKGSIKHKLNCKLERKEKRYKKR